MSAKIYNFQSSRLHRGSGRRRGRRSLLQRLVRQLGVLVALGFMAAGYSAWDRDLPVAAGPLPRVLSFAPEADGAKVIKVAAATRTMPICGSGKRSNCVVDGDTLWLNGEKIRVEGMNAPETKGRCERERRLAMHATQRELLSSDPRHGAREWPGRCAGHGRGGPGSRVAGLQGGLVRVSRAACPR